MMTVVVPISLMFPIPQIFSVIVLISCDAFPIFPWTTNLSFPTQLSVSLVHYHVSVHILLMPAFCILITDVILSRLVHHLACHTSDFLPNSCLQHLLQYVEYSCCIAHQPFIVLLFICNFFLLNVLNYPSFVPPLTYIFSFFHVASSSTMHVLFHILFPVLSSTSRQLPLSNNMQPSSLSSYKHLWSFSYLLFSAYSLSLLACFSWPLASLSLSFTILSTHFCKLATGTNIVLMGSMKRLSFMFHSVICFVLFWICFFTLSMTIWSSVLSPGSHPRNLHLSFLFGSSIFILFFQCSQSHLRMSSLHRMQLYPC